jgi:hypothetical protein
MFPKMRQLMFCKICTPLAPYFISTFLLEKYESTVTLVLLPIAWSV